MQVTRELLPGSYPFKFIIDDVWCASPDYPTMSVRGTWGARVMGQGGGGTAVPAPAFS